MIFIALNSLHAQKLNDNYPATGLLKTVEIEVGGHPTWQKIISLGQEGLLLFVKKDINKALIIKFDTVLNRVWENEVFLDIEQKPSSYYVDNQQLTFLFNENQGMYYQLFSIDLKNGKEINRGFEIRDFFQDQSYVAFKDRILIAGTNEKGGVFYDFNFKSNLGEFYTADLVGKAQVQFINYNSQSHFIETLWSIKEQGYSNEKKKKGEFIKNAFVVYAKFDTLGKLISKNAIKSNTGNFPMTAQLTTIDAMEKVVTGVYQSNNGVKGVYFSKIENDKTIFTKFYDYRKLIVGIEDLNDEQFKKKSNTFSFLLAQSIFVENQISIGGSFYQFTNEVVSVDNPEFVGYNLNSHNFIQRTKTKQVKSSYKFSNGFAVNFDRNGDLLKQQTINIKQTSSELDDVLAINNQLSVAICNRGNLIVTNLKNLRENNIYKLSTENNETKNNQFIAKYQNVKNWYGNYFIADGSRVKFEVIKEMSASKEKPSRPQKRRRQIPETNVKKIIYLSKVLNSSF